MHSSSTVLAVMPTQTIVLNMEHTLRKYVTIHVTTHVTIHVTVHWKSDTTWAPSKNNYVSQLHVRVCIQILSSPNFIADASTITRPNHSTIADVQDLTISIHRFFKYIVKKYLTLFLFPDVYVRHVEPGFLCMVTCCTRVVHTLL